MMLFLHQNLTSPNFLSSRISLLNILGMFESTTSDGLLISKSPKGWCLFGPPLGQGAKRCPCRPVPANCWSLVVSGNHRHCTWAQWHAWKNETRLGRVGAPGCQLGWAGGPPFFVWGGLKGITIFSWCTILCVFLYLVKLGVG